MVREREQISEETVTKLKTTQENRCGTCGDLLRRYEKHHKNRFAKVVQMIWITLCYCALNAMPKKQKKSKNRRIAVRAVYFWNQDLAQGCIIYLQIYLFQDNFTGATWSNKPEQENKGAHM